MHCYELTNTGIPKTSGYPASAVIFLHFWFLYAFIIQAAYDCNLRAFLMSADFEPTVETAKDIIEQVKNRLFISYNAHVVNALGSIVVLL